MIRVTLRQFRTEATRRLRSCSPSLAIVLAVTGPHLAHVYDAFESSCKAARDCATAPNPVLNVDKPLQSALPFIVAHRARARRALLRRTAHRPRARDRHLPPRLDPERHPKALARGEARARRDRRHGDRRTAHVDGDWWASPLDAVNQNRFGARELQLPRRRADRVCGVRLRARGDGRCAAAQDGGGDGRHGRGIRGGAPRGRRTGFARTSPRRCASRFPSQPVRVRASSMGVAQGTMYLQRLHPERCSDARHWAQVALTAPQVNVPNGWVYSTTAGRQGGARANEPLPVPGLSRAQAGLEELASSAPAAPMQSHSSTRASQALRDLPHGPHLSAAESLLAVPVGRDGNLPRRCAGAVRAHLLVAATPVRVIPQAGRETVVLLPSPDPHRGMRGRPTARLITSSSSATHRLEIDGVAQPCREGGDGRLGVIVGAVEPPIDDALDPDAEWVEEGDGRQGRGGDGDRRVRSRGPWSSG